MSEPTPPQTTPGPREGTCLITGASGFIGGHLAERLAAEGYPVRCIVRGTSNTTRLEALDVELVRGDLTDPRSLVAAAEGCTTVVHAGALVSDWATINEIARINLQGTRNVLGACVQAATVRRLVHVSSTDIYGHPGTPATDETHVPEGFANWYAQTKLAAEAEVRRIASANALDYVILRPATVYGPGSKDVVGEIARALQNGSMLLIDRGRAIAGLCYVENLIDAILLALELDAARGEAFNVTDGLDVTWKQFTDDLAAGLGCRPARWSMPYRLAHAIGAGLERVYRVLRKATRLRLPPLLSRQAVQVLGVDQDFDNRKLRETLGWEPRVDYASGLAQTLAWLKDEDRRA